MFVGLKLCCEVWFDEFLSRFFYLAVSNAGPVCVRR